MKENMKNDALLRGGPAGWEKYVSSPRRLGTRHGSEITVDGRFEPSHTECTRTTRVVWVPRYSW